MSKFKIPKNNLNNNFININMSNNVENQIKWVNKIGFSLLNDESLIIYKDDNHQPTNYVNLSKIDNARINILTISTDQEILKNLNYIFYEYNQKPKITNYKNCI